MAGVRTTTTWLVAPSAHPRSQKPTRSETGQGGPSPGFLDSGTVHAWKITKMSEFGVSNLLLPLRREEEVRITPNSDMFVMFQMWIAPESRKLGDGPPRLLSEHVGFWNPGGKREPCRQCSNSRHLRESLIWWSFRKFRRFRKWGGGVVSRKQTCPRKQERRALQNSEASAFAGLGELCRGTLRLCFRVATRSSRSNNDNFDMGAPPL